MFVTPCRLQVLHLFLETLRCYELWPVHQISAFVIERVVMWHRLDQSGDMGYEPNMCASNIIWYRGGSRNCQRRGLEKYGGGLWKNCYFNGEKIYWWTKRGRYPLGTPKPSHRSATVIIHILYLIIHTLHFRTLSTTIPSTSVIVIQKLWIPKGMPLIRMLYSTKQGPSSSQSTHPWRHGRHWKSLVEKFVSPRMLRRMCRSTWVPA